MTNEELERAVERLTADLTANHAMTLGGAVVRTSDLRLLLSERAELLAAVERMRVALKFYAVEHEFPSDGPWGVNSDDAGAVARAALTTGEANHKDKP